MASELLEIDIWGVHLGGPRRVVPQNYVKVFVSLLSPDIKTVVP